MRSPSPETASSFRERGSGGEESALNLKYATTGVSAVISAPMLSTKFKQIGYTSRKTNEE